MFTSQKFKTNEFHNSFGTDGTVSGAAECHRTVIPGDMRMSSPRSGPKKAHKHKQFCPVTAWVRGGGLPTGWPGVKCFMCCVRNPRNINIFVRIPGGSVTGVTEKLFMYQMFMCLFWPLLGLRFPRSNKKKSVNYALFFGISLPLPLPFEFCLFMFLSWFTVAGMKNQQLHYRYRLKFFRNSKGRNV